MEVPRGCWHRGNVFRKVAVQQRISSLNPSGAGGRAASKIIAGAGERKVEVGNSDHVPEEIVQVARGCAVKRKGKRPEEPRQAALTDSRATV